jgi:MerR family mercuric resistance operon transcriptional regulator
MRKMTIGDLAKASGVHLETIRYYERIGLIRKPSRAAGGYRLYETADLARLRFIRCGRALGFGLEKVQTLLTLQDAQGGSCEQVRAIAQEQIKALHAKVTQFLWMKETLIPSPADQNR